MEAKEIEALIRFHQAGLDQYRQYISSSSQHLEEQTIKALGELRDAELESNARSDAQQEALDILRKRLAKQE